MIAVKWIAVAALLTCLTACGSDDGDADPDAAAATDASVSLTWNSFAADFFETYCHDCHGPGDVLRDYSAIAMVRAEMAKIRCGVSRQALGGCTINPSMFPIGTGPKPTDGERDMLVQWIDEGALE